MALMELTFHSEALGFEQAINVFLPEPKDLGLKKLGAPYTENLPVMYLLHGHTDNHTAWLRRSNMERYLHHSSYNMICVTTSMRNFYYTDMVHGYKYLTFMAEELPNMIESMFRASHKREDRFIVGLSMGGYGALKIAMTYPERYAAVASLSGAVSLDGDQNGELNFEHHAIFGTKRVEDIKGNGHDIRHLILSNREAGRPQPKLYVSCGREDYILGRNRAFEEWLIEQNIEHDYFEQDGMAHEWAFWDSEGYKMVNSWLPVNRG